MSLPVTENDTRKNLQSVRRYHAWAYILWVRVRRLRDAPSKKVGSDDTLFG